jgi:hypothetical protein
MASFRPSLGSERALFSQLGLGTTALSGDALTSGLLLFRHVGDGRDHGFEERLQLRLLTVLRDTPMRCAMSAWAISF